MIVPWLPVISVNNDVSVFFSRPRFGALVSCWSRSVAVKLESLVNKSRTDFCRPFSSGPCLRLLECTVPAVNIARQFFSYVSSATSS
jgi:hypothetical protein